MRSYKKPETTDTEVQNYITKRITINQSTGCWEWSLMKRQGYGVTDTGTRAFKHCNTEYLHRISYLVYKGPIEESEVIRHRCNNRACCNPDHLEPGSVRQNMLDKCESVESMTTPALQFLLQNLHTKIAQVQSELDKRKAPDF